MIGPVDYEEDEDEGDELPYVNHVHCEQGGCGKNEIQAGAELCQAQTQLC